MVLHNIPSEHLELIIDSVNTNPSIEAHIREEILNTIRLQFKEQLKGGAWKRRMREQGHVI
jgi:hypothetical protein